MLARYESKSCDAVAMRMFRPSKVQTAELHVTIGNNQFSIGWHFTFEIKVRT